MSAILERHSYEPSPYLTPEEPSTLPSEDGPESVATTETMSKTGTIRISSDQVGAEVPVRKQKKSNSKTSPLAKANGAEKNSGLRFMIVEHPDQLKDKAQMRKNRMHVMHNYLAKEAQNPDSKDTRVHGHGRASAKRKSAQREASPAKSNDTTTNLGAPPNSSRLNISRLTPAESIQSNSSRESADDGVNRFAAKTARTANALNKANANAAANRWHTSSIVDGNGPLVNGIGGYFENSKYMRAAIDDIPFRSPSPQNRLTGSLEPFGSWPSFFDPAIDIYELKWKCSQRFGSKSLSMHWIPTILRARHAFLSTLCISSAHDDIMTRSMLPPHLHRGNTLTNRFKVRDGVIQMINESLSDPEMRIADETIVAVLHVLSSEIMGCNDQSMQIHQEGLHAMVRERGGLDRLGAGGQLAFVLTITNYMIGAVRESVPHRDYVQFTSSQDTRIPQDAQRLPESPIYARPTGYKNISAALQPTSQMYQLLETLRIMNHKFCVGTMTTHTPDAADYSSESVTSLYGKIFAIEPASEQDFDGLGERNMFEAVRLASLIYAHALANKIPLSKASSQVRSSSVSVDGRIEEPEPMPIQIKNALMRTDLSYCWDHLAGVLFWVALVAGAAANPGPLRNEDRVGEDEDARKWITAIGVRCCIVLSFEYGASILETLKRMIAIERILAGNETADDTSLYYGTGGNDEVDQRFGPMEPPYLQRGFADFAEDFLSI